MSTERKRGYRKNVTIQHRPNHLLMRSYDSDSRKYIILAVVFVLLGSAVYLITPRRMLRTLGIVDAETQNVSAMLYSDVANTYEPNTPRPYSGFDVQEELNRLLQTYPEISGIITNMEMYPQDLLAAMCNNPEMIPFVKSMGVWSEEMLPILTEQEKSLYCPLFLQWDVRWGYHPYGSSFIALTGCGPACLAMVINTLMDDTEITPITIADYSEDAGYYVPGVGTAWSLLSEGCLDFGVEAVDVKIKEAAMKWHLDMGHPLICSMGPGDFTSAGHFIVIYDYNEDGFLVNDPNCVERSLRCWTFEELESQIRQIWGYKRKVFWLSAV